MLGCDTRTGPDCGLYYARDRTSNYDFTLCTIDEFWVVAGLCRSIWSDRRLYWCQYANAC
ncbi:hypothetical protein RSAG8_10981, partial [Rhizoctonia solani AG-8 WAC10335]